MGSIGYIVVVVVQREKEGKRQVSGNMGGGDDRVFQAEPALVYDSVQVFAHGLAALDRSHVLKPVNLSCDKEEPWDDGLSLYNYISSVSLLYYIYIYIQHYVLCRLHSTIPLLRLMLVVKKANPNESN